MEMMQFRLKAGTYQNLSGQKFKPGDLVKSAADLAKKFPEKFDLIPAEPEVAQTTGQNTALQSEEPLTPTFTPLQAPIVEITGQNTDKTEANRPVFEAVKAEKGLYNVVNRESGRVMNPKPLKKKAATELAKQLNGANPENGFEE